MKHNCMHTVFYILMYVYYKYNNHVCMYYFTIITNLHAYVSHCVQIYPSLKKLYRFIMFWQSYM